MPALNADEMVVVPTSVQLEHGFSALEVVADEDAGLLELG
jgi:hypothetical protein